MTRYIRSIAMTFVVAVFTFTGAAMAQSFTGNWPATVTHSQRSNGTDCISLTDNGSFGAPHSGPASMVSNGNTVTGSFTVVDGLLTISFSYPSGEGDCCSYQVFTAHASKGQIGSGVYNFFGITDLGLLTFGKKDSCTL